MDHNENVNDAVVSRSRSRSRTATTNSCSSKSHSSCQPCCRTADGSTGGGDLPPPPASAFFSATVAAPRKNREHSHPQKEHQMKRSLLLFAIACVLISGGTASPQTTGTPRLTFSSWSGNISTASAQLPTDARV